MLHHRADLEERRLVLRHSSLCKGAQRDPELGQLLREDGTTLLLEADRMVDERAHLAQLRTLRLDPAGQFRAGHDELLVARGTLDVLRHLGVLNARRAKIKLGGACNLGAVGRTSGAEERCHHLIFIRSLVI